MYGAFSGISFSLVAGVALVVIALALFASPLFAVGIALVAAVFLLLGMSALRRRSAAQDESAGGAPDTEVGGPGASASGAGQPGAPASGEG
jgi:hypothetical protein